MIKGMIVLWSGSIETIPWGWHLCDGDNGTPDLRSKFVVGAGPGMPPDLEGGTFTHDHTFTGDSHAHGIDSGSDIESGIGYNNYTQWEPAVGTTDESAHLPPYYALAFIMKL